METANAIDEYIKTVESIRTLPSLIAEVKRLLAIAKGIPSVLPSVLDDLDGLQQELNELPEAPNKSRRKEERKEYNRKRATASVKDFNPGSARYKVVAAFVRNRNVAVKASDLVEKTGLSKAAIHQAFYNAKTFVKAEKKTWKLTDEAYQEALSVYPHDLTGPAVEKVEQERKDTPVAHSVSAS